MLGGETSGHIICSDVTSTGDGMIAALKVFFAVVDSGSSLSQLVADLKKFPQVMINVARNKEVDIESDPQILRSIEQAESTLGDSGRVLLRPSGTEPLVRVMVEGSEAEQVGSLAEQLAADVKSVIG